MSKVKVGAFSISLDGFGAGLRQDLTNPLGVRGFELHSWFMETEAFKKMHGLSGGIQGVDNDFALKSFENVGAWILGRNMFGPVRGSWRDVGINECSHDSAGCAQEPSARARRKPSKQPRKESSERRKLRRRGARVANS